MYSADWLTAPPLSLVPSREEFAGEVEACRQVAEAMADGLDGAGARLRLIAGRLRAEDTAA